MSKATIFAICTVILFCIPIIPLTQNSEHGFEDVIQDVKPSQMLSNPIVITSNLGMLNAGFDGDGSAGNPFRIFSLFITTDDTYGIWISNVDYYFDIWDCLITGSPHLGIGIRNCVNVNISDTTVTNAEYGIQVEDAALVSIDNCIVTPQSVGKGFNIDGVTLGTISHCIITGGETGCQISSSLIIVDGNTFIDCNNGILGEPATSCFISSNRFENCSQYGIRLEDGSRYFTITGNTFRGFYTGGILMRYTENCSIMLNNFTHCGLTVIGSGVYDYDHTVIGNFVNGKPLLYLYNVDNAQYTGDDYGQIYLISCEDITISDGLITSTQRGVFIAYSTECVIRDMMITACQVGVNIDNSDFISILNCTIRLCSTGVLLFSGANNNFIINNQICYSFNNGVLLNPSTTLNVLVNNSFYNNGDELLDNGNGNMWDDTHQFGNFYDDYVGYGNYTISGSAGSLDHYPRRYVPTSSGSIDIPIEVIATAGLALSAIAVILVFVYLKRVWDSKDF